MKRLVIHNHFAKDAGRAVSPEEEERNRADAYQRNGISRDVYTKGSPEANATSQVTSKALRNDPALLKEFNEISKRFYGSPAKQGTYTNSDLRHKIARMKEELGGTNDAMVEGKQVKVGDVVGFKSDYEQYGKITAINGDKLTLYNPSGFGGEYLRYAKTTVVRASDCWLD